MSELNHHEGPDPVGEAARALRDYPTPAGPPAELTAATVAAVAARLTDKRRRRRRIMRMMQYGGVSALAAAALLALAWPPARSPAEDVKKALRKADQATSMRVRTELDSPDGKFTSTQYREGDKMRADTEPIGLTVIVDSKAKKALMLMRKAKQYRAVDLEKDKLVGKMTKTVSDHLGAFKFPADDKVKTLPDEYLDGRKTKVFEIKNVDVPDLKAKSDLKVWIDPKTVLPVKSRMVLRVSDKKVTTEYTFLGFNEELDPKLFDMTVPEGFKRMEEKKKDK